MPFNIKLLTGLFIHALIWMFIYDQGWMQIHENNLIENSQSVIIGISSLLFLTLAIISRTRREKLFYGSAFFLMVNFLLREMELAETSRNAAVIFLTEGPGFVLWMAVCWASLTIALFLSRREIWGIFVEWAKTPAAHILLWAAACLIGASFFEKNEQHYFIAILQPTSEFWEEVLESSAYIVILVSGWLTLVQQHKRHK